MHMPHQMMLQAMRADLTVFRVLAAAHVPITPSVLEGVWEWFYEVDLPLPIPALPFRAEDRAQLTETIIREMVDVIDTLLADMERRDSGRPREGTDVSPVALVDSLVGLWRELAGLWAPLVNSGIPKHTRETLEIAKEDGLQWVMDAFGITEDQARAELRGNGSLRLSLRRSGFDPDTMAR